MIEPDTSPGSLPPGAPAAEPDVKAARAAVEAARGSFGRELAALESKGRDAVDVKARIRRLPGELARDPRKLAGVAAVGAGIIALGAIRRRGRKPALSGTLPADVEAAIAALGDDGRKVRAALDRSFSDYLASHGVEAAPKRRGLPPGVATLVVPIGTVAVREIIRRAGSRAAARRASEPVSPTPTTTGGSAAD